MITKTKYNNSLIYLDGENEDFSNKNIIVAIPRRFPIKWSIDKEKLKNDKRFAISMDFKRFKLIKQFATLRNFQGCPQLSFIPSTLKQPRVFITNEVSNHSRDVLYYIRKLNK